MDRVIFWDFDGTLCYRPRTWSGTMLDLLAEIEPANTLNAGRLRSVMSGGYPWDMPDIPHPELSTPDLWWQRITNMIAEGYVKVGVDEATAQMLANRYRCKYLDHAGWTVYDDVVQTLSALRESGWHHVILSNHVPELKEIVEALGLGALFEHVITSARVGFEKPNKEIFRLALEMTGMPKTCWMVGDNPDADVLGAEKVGIKAVLVRRSDSRVARNCQSLTEVIGLISDGEVQKGDVAEA